MVGEDFGVALIDPEGVGVSKTVSIGMGFWVGLGSTVWLPAMRLPMFIPTTSAAMTARILMRRKVFRCMKQMLRCLEV
jgi:hypothetical protein